MTLLGLVVNIIWLFPLMENQASNTPSAMGARMGGIIGLGGTLLGLALPVAMLVVMNRPAVKAAFEGANAPPEMPPPPDAVPPYTPPAP